MRCHADQDCTHSWRVSSDFRRFRILSSREKLIVLLHVKVIGAWEVRAARKLDGQLGVVENVKDIRHHSLFINTDTKNLTAFVHANDTARGLKLCGDEYGLARNAVHAQFMYRQTPDSRS